MFGHMSDFVGCEQKILEKSKQLSGNPGVIVVDVTAIAGGVPDWSTRTTKLIGGGAHTHVRAVVLTSRLNDRGFLCRHRAVVVHNPSATNLPPGAATIERLFSTIE